MHLLRCQSEIVLFIIIIIECVRLLIGRKGHMLDLLAYIYILFKWPVWYIYEIMTNMIIYIQMRFI